MIKPAFSTLPAHSLRVILGAVYALVFVASMAAQPPQLKLQANLKNYIRQYSDEAVKQMIEFRIPASVVLAQAIFESGSGTSELAQRSNNHFGIKCHVEWLGDTITKDDDTLNECFRKYITVEESFRDHSMFLVTRERYGSLFGLEVTDYKGWCYGLKNAGYATWPTYAEDLVKLIEDEKLYELDQTIILETSMASRHIKAPPENLLMNCASGNNFSLTDFLKEGVLWLDEKDVLVQSLDMVIDSGENVEEPVVAGN